MESMLSALINERQMGERMEPRSTKANRVQRNLFGPVDHDDLQQDFQSVLHAGLERAKQRWNFDFSQEMPAEGPLQWEELQDREVPTFYHPCVIGKARKPLQPVNWMVAKEAKVRRTGQVKLLGNAKPTKEVPRKKNLGGKKRQQTTLTYYYTAKRQMRRDMQTPVKKLTF